MTSNQSTESLSDIECRYDPEVEFRATGKKIGYIIIFLLVSMSVYHFYASGFGVIRELIHRGIHLSFVLGLVFLLFGFRRGLTADVSQPAWYRIGGIGIWDLSLIHI